VKRIMRYLKANPHIGVTIDLKNDELDVFSNASHGDHALEDWRSISRGAYYLGGSLIHWTCRKQRTPAHSSVESELVGASNILREGIWLLRLGEILGTRGPIRVHMDNKAAHNITEAKGLTRKVKHLEVRDAYIHILRERGIVKIVKVALNQNCSDIMTKAFGSPREFVHARNMLFRLSCESAGECCGESSS
jgi:hypothetical protein